MNADATSGSRQSDQQDEYELVSQQQVSKRFGSTHDICDLNTPVGYAFIVYSRRKVTGTRILNCLLRRDSGGKGNGDAFFTISNACLSSASKPLDLLMLLATKLPLLSICSSTFTVPCQPRICAILGYCLCLAISRVNKLP